MIKLKSPTLLLDKSKVMKNIEFMALKAKKHNVGFRPHFKTHQSLTIANWFRDFGVNKIAVSSIKMARYFANAGWTDITIAFPVNILEIDEINDLADKIKFNITIVSLESLLYLEKLINSNVGFFIKINTGYGRAGIRPTSIEKIDSILEKSKDIPKLDFKGFLTHAGHTYKAKDRDTVLTIHEDASGKLAILKNKYKVKYPELIISYGDTPSCSIADNFEGIDELRPGNFVFYDLMQWNIGSCKLNSIAVAMACPIVAVHRRERKIIIHGGAVHFSKETIIFKNREIYGIGADFTSNGWNKLDEGIILTSLSQEHGIISASEEAINKYKIGNIIIIIPVHSCLTANLMQQYITLDGEKIDHMSGQKI